MNTLEAAVQLFKSKIKDALSSDSDFWSDKSFLLYLASPSTNAIRSLDKDLLLNNPPFNHYLSEQILDELASTNLRLFAWIDSVTLLMGVFDRSQSVAVIPTFNWRNSDSNQIVDAGNVDVVGPESDVTELISTLDRCRQYERRSKGVI